MKWDRRFAPMQASVCISPEGLEIRLVSSEVTPRRPCASPLCYHSLQLPLTATRTLRVHINISEIRTQSQTIRIVSAISYSPSVGGWGELAIGHMCCGLSCAPWLIGVAATMQRTEEGTCPVVFTTKNTNECSLTFFYIFLVWESV